MPKPAPQMEYEAAEPAGDADYAEEPELEQRTRKRSRASEDPAYRDLVSPVIVRGFCSCSQARLPLSCSGPGRGAAEHRP